MRLADRFLGSRHSESLQIPTIRQNKDRHEAAFDPPTLFVNTQKLGTLREPSLFG
jgi:hypothetical protein